MKRLALAIAFAVVVSAGEARSEDPSLAQQRFQRGRELYKASEFGPAHEEFRASLELFASPNTRLYLARSLRELGRWDEAAKELENTLREAETLASKEPRYAATRDAAKVELEALELRLGTFRLHIVDPPKGTRVSIAGREVPFSGAALSRRVLPGPLAIEVNAPGYATARRDVVIALQRETNVDIALEPVSAPRAPVVQSTAADQSVPVPTWIGLGVAATGAASFAVFWTMAAARYDYLSENCRPAVSTDCRDARASGPNFEVGAYVAGGVGLVGLGVAAISYFASRTSSPAPQSLQLRAAPGGVGLGGAF